jgi:hypothetical protein
MKTNLVNEATITKMSTTLASWRARVKNIIGEGKSPEDIYIKDWVKEEDLRIFHGKFALPVTDERTQWGKYMRSKNIGNHHLGSGVYFTALPKWKKEDEERKARGKPSLHDNYPTEHAKNFLRARFVADKVTKELTTDTKMREFMTALEKQNAAASAASQTSSHGSSTRAEWDTPFNMAMNEVKGQPVTKKPSGGHVADYGDVKWAEKYNETPMSTRRERRPRENKICRGWSRTQ